MPMLSQVTRWFQRMPSSSTTPINWDSSEPAETSSSRTPNRKPSLAFWRSASHSCSAVSDRGAAGAASSNAKNSGSWYQRASTGRSAGPSAVSRTSGPTSSFAPSTGTSLYAARCWTSRRLGDLLDRLDQRHVGQREHDERWQAQPPPEREWRYTGARGHQ